MTQSEGAKWVELYLVPQTEGVDMPKCVIGVLLNEDAEVYMLGGMLEEVEDEIAGWVTRPSVNINLIRKMYVWRVSILEGTPYYGSSQGENEGGGLG